jgi:hypothetical protein
MMGGGLKDDDWICSIPDFGAINQFTALCKLRLQNWDDMPLCSLSDHIFLCGQSGVRSHHQGLKGENIHSKGVT